MKQRRLRILLISSIRYWGGGEAWMLSAAGGLTERGHSVTLVCQPGSRLAQRAQAAGLDPVLIRMRADIDPAAIIRIHHLLKSRRIQLVCANMDKEVRLAGLAARMAGVPLVRRRGSDMPFPNKFRFRLADRLLVDGIIVNSRATRSTLLEGNRWLRREKLHLIYNGISLKTPRADAPEEVVEELGLSGRHPVLLMVGLLKSRKGHEILFQAARRMRDRYPRMVVLVVGEGPLRARLEDLSRRLGIDGHVRFTGFRDDVGRLMRAADMVVLPSRNEGFGYVLAEAMAQARPVVASRTSSIPEVVEEGRTGLLVPPGDAAALGDALIDLAGDPERARRMGLAGRRRVERFFSLEGMLEKVEAFFDRMIAEGRLSRVP